MLLRGVLCALALCHLAISCASDPRHFRQQSIAPDAGAAATSSKEQGVKQRQLLDPSVSSVVSAVPGMLLPCCSA